MPSRDRPESVAILGRPTVCPCCGSKLTEDRNQKKRYRAVRYECGASGWFDEELDRFPLDNVVLFTGPMQWTHACPHAMRSLQQANALGGKAFFHV